MKPATTFLIAVSASLLPIGSFAQAPGTTLVVREEPAPAPNSEVGISSHDGITVSGEDILVTRNGISEKLTKDLELPNGIRVQPDGTVTTHEGNKIKLRPLQILTFAGRFLDAPVRESVPSATTTTTTVTTGTAVAPVTPTIIVEKPALTKEAADEAARAEAERRTNAAKESQIKAAEGAPK